MIHPKIGKFMRMASKRAMRARGNVCRKTSKVNMADGTQSVRALLATGQDMEGKRMLHASAVAMRCQYKVEGVRKRLVVRKRRERRDVPRGRGMKV